jgi:hypothetical protein
MKPGGTMEKQTRTNFSGTYFDKDAVLRLEVWLRVLGWALMLAYFFEAGYTIYQNVYNAIIGNFQPDIYFLFTNLSHALQGVMLFAILHGLGKILLILLDIEDNSRRSARK